MENTRIVKQVNTTAPCMFMQCWPEHYDYTLSRPILAGLGLNHVKEASTKKQLKALEPALIPYRAAIILNNEISLEPGNVIWFRNHHMYKSMGSYYNVLEIVEEKDVTGQYKPMGFNGKCRSVVMNVEKVETVLQEPVLVDPSTLNRPDEEVERIWNEHFQKAF